MKPEQERLKALLAESVALMCRTGLSYRREMRIEAVIGITIDTDDVMLVHINDRFDGKDGGGGSMAMGSQQPVAGEEAEPMPAVAAAPASGAPADHTQNDTTSSTAVSEVTHKVFTRLSATDSKAQSSSATPAARRGGSGTGRGNSGRKAASGRRGRKQKLVPLTNGQMDELQQQQQQDSEQTEGGGRTQVVADKPDGEPTADHGVTAGVDTYGSESFSIKSEPQDLMTSMANGLDPSVSGTRSSRSLKREHSSKGGDDDALAMQQSYTTQDISSLSTATDSSSAVNHKDHYTPPRKRQLSSNTNSLENHENEVSCKNHDNHSNNDSGSHTRMKTKSPAWPGGVGTTPTTTTTEDSITAKTEVTTPGCSTWCSTPQTQQRVRSRRPSNGLQSTAVKRMLSEYLVEPIAQTDCKVCTFRLMWHGSIDESEQVWNQLAYYQENIDRLITEPAQVALAVSAVTATSTRPKSSGGKLGNSGGNGASSDAERFRTFPGLAYWIVLQNEQDFTETDLYNRLYESCFGARLKSLSDQAVAADLQEMCSTLYLVVKDNVDGYVRWKLDSVLPKGTGNADIAEGESTYQPVVKVYARAEQDFNTLMMAREALQKNRFYFSLLRTDT